MVDVDRINAKIDILDYTHELRRSGAYHIGAWPLCGGTDRFSVKRVENGQLWHCRGCSAEKYSDGIKFIQSLHNLSFADVCRQFKNGAIPALTFIIYDLFVAANAIRAAGTRLGNCSYTYQNHIIEVCVKL